MSQPSDTPETDAQDFFFIEGSLGHTETGVDVNFARELERQRDAAREDAEKYFKAGFDAGIASCYDPTEPSDADAALTQYVTLQAKTKP